MAEKARIALRISEDMLYALKKLALEKRMTLHDMFLEIIEEMIKDGKSNGSK